MIERMDSDLSLSVQSSLLGISRSSFSRYVISWNMDQTLEMPFVIEALENAFAVGSPLILNSDQGSHFTSPQYTDMLEERGIRISMDGKNRAIDNIFTERLWRSVKYEEVYLKNYANPREAWAGLRWYFRFYNEERPHQSLDYRTPSEVYFRAGQALGARKKRNVYLNQYYSKGA